MEENVGEFLRGLRLKSGYVSQRKLGEVSGVSSAIISRIESNIQHPLPGTLLRLSTYYKGVTYKELMKSCGYLDKDSMSEQLDLYQKSELFLVEELRNYPILHKELIESPSQLKYLDKLWAMFKEMNQQQSDNKQE